MLTIKFSIVFFSPGTALLDHLDSLTGLLDKTLELAQKDEYEIASTILQNVIVSLVHIRPKQVKKMDRFIADYGFYSLRL